MKALFKLFICICLLLCLTACGKDNEKKDPSLTIPDKPTDVETKPDTSKLRKAMDAEKHIAAVSFLGLYEYDSYSSLDDYLNEKNLLENYPFMSEIKRDQFVETEGGELYCIVPLDPNAEVTVYEWIIDEYNDYMGEIGDVLYHEKSGTPIIIKGNVSDIMPNMMVEIIDSNNRKIEYVPYMGQMDGYLSTPKGTPTVYDFTEYNKVIPPQPFDLNILSDRGNWEITYISTNNELIEAYFYFDEDRQVSMSYGVDSTSPMVFYEGSYGVDYYSGLPENALYIYLVKTEDYTDENYPEEIYTVLTFTQRDYDMFVYADYYSEDPLFANDNTKHFVFRY